MQLRERERVRRIGWREYEEDGENKSYETECVGEKHTHIQTDGVTSLDVCVRDIEVERERRGVTSLSLSLSNRSSWVTSVLGKAIDLSHPQLPTIILLHIKNKWVLIIKFPQAEE